MKSTERDARSSSVPAMRPPGSPRRRVPGRLEYERAAGERPPRARPQRRGSPGPIPNPAVKPAFAESTAAQGCGRAGRRARGGRFAICARGGVAAPEARTARREGPAGDCPLRAFFAFGCRKMLRFSLYALREIVVGLTGAYLEFGTMKSHNSVTLTQRGNA